MNGWLQENSPFKDRLLSQLKLIKEPRKLLPLFFAALTHEGIKSFLVLEEPLINKCGIFELAVILGHGKILLAQQLNVLLQQYPIHFKHFPPALISEIVSKGDQEPIRSQIKLYFGLPADVIQMVIQE